MSAVTSKALLKLWNAWNIRVLILVSLALQIFLNLTAQTRKQSGVGRKWYFRWSFWLAYLSADWVAISAVGAIMGHSKDDPSSSCTDDDGSPPGDILMFWAPFLLLHLGGPDNITAYSLEDNRLWKRHLHQLILQVGFTLFSIANFSSNSKLLFFPTLLVLFSGIIKYGERNIAFYSASFEHFGDKWLDKKKARIVLPIPKQFQLVLEKKKNRRLDLPVRVAVKLFGILQRLLVGPLLDQSEVAYIKDTFGWIKHNRNGVFPKDVLRVMEMELSLLYEVLHTKLPVIASKVGLYSRLVNLGCAVAAFGLFTYAQKMHNHLVGMADVCVTYVLLSGAILLDLASVWLLIKNSDWFAIYGTQKGSEILDKRRWSNTVSQSNLITFHVNEYSGLFKTLADLPIICILFQAMKEFRCVSSKEFGGGGENHLWSFIVEQVGRIERDEQPIQQVWLLQKSVQLLREKELLKHFDKMDYTRSLLALHVATELCFHQEDDLQSNSTEEERRNYKAICKQLSGYMFYLAVTQSAMMSPVLDNWELELQDYMNELQHYENEIALMRNQSNVHSSEETLVCHGIYDYAFNQDNRDQRLPSPVYLARDLMNRSINDRWMVMSQIWVEFMCYAAINCNPDVHARQLSQGGELLTLVWLLMNHFGLVLRSYKILDFS